MNHVSDILFSSSFKRQLWGGMHLSVHVSNEGLLPMVYLGLELTCFKQCKHVHIMAAMSILQSFSALVMQIVASERQHRLSVMLQCYIHGSASVHRNHC